MNRIGIIGAMEEEVAMLKEQMKDVTVKEKAAMEFFHGTLNKKEVVVVSFRNRKSKCRNLCTDFSR